MIRRTFLMAAVLFAGCGDDHSYDTPEEIMAAASPQWRPQGGTATLGSASFLVPPGWEQTTYSDGIAIRTAKDSNGLQCEIFVLEPRAAASGDARYQQLLDATRTLFPAGTEIQDQYGGTDLMSYRWRGATGRGWDFVGLNLSTGSQTLEVLPFLADFAGTAVPVVVIEPRRASWDCISIVGDFGMEVATVFHSLRLEGASETGAMAKDVLGEWFSSDGTTGSFYVFGANGHYIDVSTYGGTVETSPGEWRDEYASWSGDGSYVVRGDVLGLFPNDGDAKSRFIRHYESVDSKGSWNRRLCWIAAYNGTPYTHCLSFKGQ